MQCILFLGLSKILMLIKGVTFVLVKDVWMHCIRLPLKRTHARVLKVTPHVLLYLFHGVSSICTVEETP